MPIRCGWAALPYGKGLALHSRTEIVYRLPGRVPAVSGRRGNRRRGAPGGKVRLVVRGDDKVLFEAVVAGSDAPQPVDLDLAGVRRLTILADFADGPNVGDHLLLCNARLSK